MHGYDHPWPAGGGKNLFNKDGDSSVINGYINSNGVFTTSTSGEKCISILLSAGTYTISKALSSRFIVATFNSAPTTGSNGTILNTSPNITNFTFTLNDQEYVCCFIYNNTGESITFDSLLNTVQVETGSSATSYSPYSNICPISGWTGAEIYHEAEYDADASPKISVNWEDEAGTVYGGTLDPVNGELKDSMWKLSNPNFGNNTPSTAQNWISGYLLKSTVVRPVIKEVAKMVSSVASVVSWVAISGEAELDKVYCWQAPASFGIAGPKSIVGETIADLNAWFVAQNVDLICEVENPTEYSITPQEMTTLYGTNVIWANTGDVAVTYIAKSAKFSFGSPLHIYNYNNLKLFGNTYIEHGKG